MGNYVCTKCGSNASSKCAGQRSVFIEDDMVTMIGNRFRYEANRVLPKTEHAAKFDFNEWTVKVEFSAYDCQDDQEAIAQMIRVLTGYPSETMKKALCDHRWKLTAPTCELGCCKAS